MMNDASYFPGKIEALSIVVNGCGNANAAGDDQRGVLSVVVGLLKAPLAFSLRGRC
jgi:hypothetical protein